MQNFILLSIIWWTNVQLCMGFVDRKQRLEYAKRYYLENKAHYKKSYAAYYSENKEKIKNRVRKRRANNLDKVKTEERVKYYKKYWPGTTTKEALERYETLKKAQKGLCAICKQTPKTVLAVDHCHLTGKVRGLLCHQCNLGLGNFKDDEVKLQNAINYLKLKD